MQTINRILAVRDTASSSLSPTMVDLLIALMVLVFVSLVLVGALYFIKRVRKSRASKAEQLPKYEPKHRRQLTITTTPYDGRKSSIYVYDEKSPMIKSSSSPPLTPDSVPEIRITFPDEHDESTGRRKSGRVVVVKIGEKGSVGLEPLSEEQLPAYEKETAAGRFQSLDLERMGGLKEKEEWA